MNLKMHIGVKVKAARNRKGLTQEQLAGAIGKAPETVSNIERGFALTGLDTLQRIAGVAGVPMAYFFEGVEDGRNVSRLRLEKEEHLVSLVRSLADDDLPLATALVEKMVEQRRP